LPAPAKLAKAKTTTDPKAKPATMAQAQQSKAPLPKGSNTEKKQELTDKTQLAS
jgi:hypothetical protein